MEDMKKYYKRKFHVSFPICDDDGQQVGAAKALIKEIVSYNGKWFVDLGNMRLPITDAMYDKLKDDIPVVED